MKSFAPVLIIVFLVGLAIYLFDPGLMASLLSTGGTSGSHAVQHSPVNIHPGVSTLDAITAWISRHSTLVAFTVVVILVGIFAKGLWANKYFKMLMLATIGGFVVWGVMTGSLHGTSHP